MLKRGMLAVLVSLTAWVVSTPGVVTIDEQGDVFDANYAFASGRLTMTRTTGGGETLDVDQLVFDKR